jgi:hypothetical protein
MNLRSFTKTLKIKLIFFFSATTYTEQHNRKTRTHIHASNGIRTHGPSVRAVKDRTCLRPRGHWDRLKLIYQTELIDERVAFHGQIKDETGGTCSTQGRNDKCKLLVGKPEGKRPLGRPRRRWEDIRMDLRKIGWEGVDWMHLAQDRDW